MGRCCHLLIGLPLKETKPGAAVTGPEAIERATEPSLPRSPSLSNYRIPPFGRDVSFMSASFYAAWPSTERLALYNGS